MDRLAKDSPTVLQDQETRQVRAVLGVRGRSRHRLPDPGPTLQDHYELLQCTRHAK